MRLTKSTYERSYNYIQIRFVQEIYKPYRCSSSITYRYDDRLVSGDVIDGIHLYCCWDKYIK